MAATRWFVGPAGELHASRRAFGAKRESVAARTVYRAHGLRPDVWGNRIAVVARGARGGMPDARRPSDARLAGRATVRVVDGQETSRGCDEGRCCKSARP